jgi:hypothetical protein
MLNSNFNHLPSVLYDQKSLNPAAWNTKDRDIRWHTPNVFGDPSCAAILITTALQFTETKVSNLRRSRHRHSRHL